MVSLASDLSALLDLYKAVDAFRAFLIDEEVLDLQSFASCAIDEAAFRLNVLGGSQVVMNLGAQGRMASAFLSAKASLASPCTDIVARAAADPDALPEGTEALLQKEWCKKYGYVPNGSRVIAPPMFNKLYKGLKKQHKIFEVPLLENIKLRSCVTSASAPGHFISNGKIMEFGLNVVEVLSNPQMWILLRALFISISFVTIEEPDFFPMEACDSLVDTLHGLVHYGRDGGLPSLEGLQQAYRATMCDWCHDVQVNGRRLQDLSNAKGVWLHYWKGNDNASLGSSDRSRVRTAPQGAALTNDSLPADVLRRMASNEGMIRSLQSQLDSDTPVRSVTGPPAAGPNPVSKAARRALNLKKKGGGFNAAKGGGGGGGGKRRRV